MPNTWVTPQLVIVSTSTSDTVRAAGASDGNATHTSEPRTSVVKHSGASSNPSGGRPVSGS